MIKPVFAALLLAATIGTARAQRAAAVPASAGTMPQDKTQPTPRLNPLVAARAEHLSTQMAHELRLNGYQTTRLRDINAEKLARLDAVEQQYAKDPQAAEAQTKAIMQASDQQLQAVLTTDQYTDYFDARKHYAQADKEYARSASAANLINSVQNPAPARANDATIGPAKTTGKSNRAAVRQ